MDKPRVHINIPEGYEIDKDKSTFEDIVFKKKTSRLMGWKEWGIQTNSDDYYRKYMKQTGVLLKLLCFRKAWTLLLSITILIGIGVLVEGLRPVLLIMLMMICAGLALWCCICLLSNDDL